jgi:hypothetical protein
MKLIMKSPIKRLNGYSWFIIIAFVCASFAMQYHTNSYFNGVFYVLPLTLVAIYWCEKAAHLINSPECDLNKVNVFHRDLFILSFSFFLGVLISLCLLFNNSDAKGWWSLIVLFMMIYGLIFSIVFSVVAISIRNHKMYTLIFSFLIIGFVSFGHFLPRYMMLPIIGSVDVFYIITCSLLIAHCLFSIGSKMFDIFFPKK